MKKLWGVLGVVLVATGNPLWAEAPSSSLRPLARALPNVAAAGPVAPVAPEADQTDQAETAESLTPTTVILRASTLAPRGSLRPQLREGRTQPAPQSATAQPPVQADATPVSAETTTQTIERRGLFGIPVRREVEVQIIEGATQLAAVLSQRPQLRPDGLERSSRAAATRATPARVTQSGTRGALCGAPGILGDRLEPIPGRIRGCGIAEPVRVREVDGITLSQPATLNCDTARALQTWLRDGVVPVVGRSGGGVSSIRVVASYACRTRNSRPGARLSEHATGNAIDIAGIGLVNGRELTVLSGWRSGDSSRLLREMHQEACGPFGTVLGPNSDRFHQDHFHFDVAGYRSGPYCR